MIARVWRGRTASRDAEAYARYVQRTGVDAHRNTPGNVGSWVLRRRDGAEVEFVVLSFWDSFEAIRTFAGDDPEVAVYYPEDERYLLVLEPNVVHYEVPVSAGVLNERDPSERRT